MSEAHRSPRHRQAAVEQAYALNRTVFAGCVSAVAGYTAALASTSRPELRTTSRKARHLSMALFAGAELDLLDLDEDEGRVCLAAASEMLALPLSAFRGV